MSSFEDFIQVELPRRPWVAIDPAQETIPVRRGAGPRQLDFIQLQEGQVLGKVGGVIAGITVPGLGAVTPKSYVHLQPTESDAWVITHNQNSMDCVALVFSSTGQMILPDELNVVDANTITIIMQTATSGKSVIIFAS